MPEIKKIDLLDIVTLFAKNKIRYFLIVLTISVFGLILSLIWPFRYTAELTFVANQGTGVNLSNGGLLGSLANISVSTPELNTEQILVILRSKDILDAIIDEFDLSKVYETDIPELLRNKLDNAIKIEEYREGGFGFSSIIAIKIIIEDEEPARSFEMLNFYYEAINSIILEKNRAYLGNGFYLLDNRFEKNKEDLTEAEENLFLFQKKHGIIEIEEQTKAIIQNIANIQSTIIELELQKSIAEKTFGIGSNEVKEKSILLNETKAKYEQLITNSQEPKISKSLQIPLMDIPDISIKYFRLFRELQVQQELYKILFPQYEQQKLNFEEIKSGLILIDEPKLPTYKSSPKRAYIVLACFLFANILAIINVLIKSWKEHIDEYDPVTKERIKKLSNELKAFR